MRNLRRRPRKVVYTAFGSSRRFVYARIGPMIEHRVHTASYPPLRYPPSKWRVSRDESLLSRFSRVQRFRSDRQTRVDDRRRRRHRLLRSRSSDGKELRSRASLFHHGACVCACARVCVLARVRVFVVSRQWSWHTCASLSVTRIRPYCVRSS